MQRPKEVVVPITQKMAPQRHIDFGGVWVVVE
jgi:hypothetical protein